MTIWLHIPALNFWLYGLTPIVLSVIGGTILEGWERRRDEREEQT